MDVDERYMYRCIELATLAAGNVAPNPMVGAVLAHDNKIIGEGYHQKFGEAHAEVNCINSVPPDLRHLIPESTLYVSLEPCTHFGKTPPCCDLIIQSKIPAVVIACRDSFEKVNGSGVKKLMDEGIHVREWILEKEALELNKRFFTFHKKQRPYIILKWAQSSNAKIANADRSRVHISNELTNQLVHKWRGEEAAIMVGTNTALFDNPSLTTRLWPGRNPVRIVIDKRLIVPAGSKLFDNTASTIILNTVKQEETGNTTYYKTGEEEDKIAVTLSILRQRNLTSLIVEGGRSLIQSFIDANCWDEAIVITNKDLFIQDGIDAPVLDAVAIKKQTIRNNELVFYRNE